MDFPRAPRRKIAGSVKLQIREPVSISIIPEEPLPDFSNILSFRPPKGFSIDLSISDVINRQKESAMERLKEIEKKAKNCRNCGRTYDAKSIKTANNLIEQFSTFAEGRASTALSYLVHHSPDGKIDITFTDNRNKDLVFSIRKDSIEVSSWLNGDLFSNFSVANIEETDFSETFNYVLG